MQIEQIQVFINLGCQSHRDKCFSNRISSLYDILLYNLFVPI